MKISFVVAVYHNEGALSKTYEKIHLNLCSINLKPLP